MTICIIAPRLPPAICGVGDYCKKLWECTMIRRRSVGKPSEVGWTYLVGDGGHASTRAWPEVTIRQFDRAEHSLLNALELSSAETVVLQYVGYGYSRDGSPEWLVRALGRWRYQRPGRRIVVMFHELWASESPWDRGFIQHFAQRRCAKALLSIAAIGVTSCETLSKRLIALGTSTPICVVPIGSNLTGIPRDKKNWRQVVIFGRECSRLCAIGCHKGLLREMARAGLLERVVIAGQGSPGSVDRGTRQLAQLLPGVDQVELWDFPGDQIPDPVLEAGLALMPTRSGLLLKSGVFHLAASLGQVPICVGGRSDGDLLIEKRHYLTYDQSRPVELIARLSHVDVLSSISADLSEMSRTIFSWEAIAAKWEQILST